MKKYLKKILNAGRDVVGINQRNLDLVYTSNPRKYFYIADDKAETKKRFESKGIPVPETYALIRYAWEIDEKLSSVAHLSDIVLKPSNGSGGNGILILHRISEGTWETPGGRRYTAGNLRMHIAAIIYGAYAHDNKDQCIIEQRIIPHALLKGIYNMGIPDVRIILHHHRPLMAMLRVPTERSGGRANLHQGAIGIGIDLETGKIKQGFYRNRPIEAHPDSGVMFTGMQLPEWEKMLSISKKAAAEVPLKYLGVDIIIDQVRGPLIIEINARPGLQIQNANMTGLGTLISQQIEQN